MTDYLDVLFTNDPAIIAANIAEAARIAAIEDADKAAAENARLERIAMRCPRCMGAGFLSQFMHRKGGECFTCGGTGTRSFA